MFETPKLYGHEIATFMNMTKLHHYLRTVTVSCRQLPVMIASISKLLWVMIACAGFGCAPDSDSEDEVTEIKMSEVVIVKHFLNEDVVNSFHKWGVQLGDVSRVEYISLGDYDFLVLDGFILFGRGGGYVGTFAIVKPARDTDWARSEAYKVNNYSKFASLSGEERYLWLREHGDLNVPDLNSLRRESAGNQTEPSRPEK